jgi:ABC-type transport system involved in multi-copper enzyme maturation permease subunit
MLYGIAFVGSWVEQIGSALQSDAAVQFGIVSSLIMPSDALWRMASTLMMPRLTSSIPGNPFALFSQPSNAMVVYAILYSLALLGVAVYFFSRRDL